jgi:hypothetical protein
MVIHHFGMINEVSLNCWFYELDLLVVLSINVFIAPCSHFHFLKVLLGVVQSSYQYFSKLFVGLQCSSPCWVKEKCGVSASYFWHIVIFCPFLMVFHSWVI